MNVVKGQEYFFVLMCKYNFILYVCVFKKQNKNISPLGDRCLSFDCQRNLIFLSSVPSSSLLSFPVF